MKICHFEAKYKIESQPQWMFLLRNFYSISERCYMSKHRVMFPDKTRDTRVLMNSQSILGAVM